MQRALWIMLGLMCCIVSLTAQHRYRAGLLPLFNLNVKVASGWKVNVKLESRQKLYEGRLGEVAGAKYVYERTDLATVLSHRFDAGSSVSAGYMMRLRNAQFIHRSIQQYSRVRPYRSFRLGQRFSTDQTFTPNEPPQFRFRYRVGIDRALNGITVNHREPYVKLTSEWLNILVGKVFDLEFRLVPVLGYAFTDNNKLEVGLDYRLDSIVAQDARSNFWLQLAWYVSL